MYCRARCGKFILLAIVGVAALGWVVMALWNWLVPALFVGAREIGYLQAMGLLLLSRILFGGMRGHHGHGRWARREQWEKMTPEEREKFQAGMHRCFGRGAKSAEKPEAPKQD